MVAEAHEFADEVIVGVDSSSKDDTFERVSGLANIAFQFELRLPGQVAPAGLAALDYATGDWILALDDDESMEPTFDALRDELLSVPDITHYYLPRKYLTNLSPPQYVNIMPWYPDWQLKLFRNDRSIVWTPPKPHLGYYVQGMGNFEARTSILHYEPLWCTPEQRVRKEAEYRKAGSAGTIEKSLEVVDGLPTSPLTVRPPPQPVERRAANTVHPGVRRLEPLTLPGWKAEILEIEMPPCVSAGASVVARLLVRNTGTMSWTPHILYWPFLNLAFRLLDSNQKLLQTDGERFPMPRQVRPGEQVRFVAPFNAPAQPGNYWLEWDLVNEHECWFADCGSPTRRHLLKVI
jgi:hypothetical protein